MDICKEAIYGDWIKLMGMKPQLQTSLRQQLKVTPHLQQAIEMLQLSSQELEKEIEKSLENNPLLEVTEESPSANKQTPEADTTEASPSTFALGFPSMVQIAVSLSKPPLKSSASGSTARSPIPCFPCVCCPVRPTCVVRNVS